VVAFTAQIAAVAKVTHAEAGAASGVVTAFNQVGGALGLAIVTTLSTSRTTAAIAAGTSRSDALVSGFHRGILISAAFMVAALVITAISPRLTVTPAQLTEAAATA
jgi:hypothetical protein